MMQPKKETNEMLSPSVFIRKNPQLFEKIDTEWSVLRPSLVNYTLKKKFSEPPGKNVKELARAGELAIGLQTSPE